MALRVTLFDKTKQSLSLLIDLTLVALIVTRAVYTLMAGRLFETSEIEFPESIENFFFGLKGKQKNAFFTVQKKTDQTKLSLCQKNILLCLALK
jgi:hypothetical protein